MTKGHVQQEGLTDDQIRQEEEFLAGVPLFNVGALFMPPIWGVAHGDLITILFYPLWIFCDNMFYSAWANPNVVSIALAVVIFLAITAVTFAYARLSSVKSAHVAADKGISREKYLKTERRWAIAMVIMGVAMLAAATWYNLCIKPTLG